MYHFAKNQIQKLLYTFIEIQNLIIFTVDNIFDKLSVLSYRANLFPLAPCQVGLTMAVDRLADKRSMHLSSSSQEVLWDANRELVAVNPRLTNWSSNRASNNAILTPS